MGAPAQSCRLLLWLLLPFIGCSTPNAEFYVSPSGDDRNSGAEGSPFATIEKAKEAAIQSFADNKSDSVTIWLEEGEYLITKPIVFDSEVFSRLGHHLNIKSVGEENAVISGGFTLKGWEKSKNGLWSIVLPKNLDSLLALRELFVGGNRAIRARFPNSDYLRVKKVGLDRRTYFYFEKDEFPLPNNIQDTEVVLLHDWSISRIPVSEVDQEEGKLTAIDSIGAKMLDFFHLDHWEEHPRYYLENDLQFLDTDYEWYFDANTRRIYLQLPATENPDSLTITIPIAKGLLVLNGSEKKPVKNIRLEGITFRYSAWIIPPKGYAGIQAAHFDPRPNTGKGWSVVPAAVSATYTDSCSFRDCRFEKLGGSGLWIGEGCTNNSVADSYFSDISANGIMIGEGRDRKVREVAWWKTVPEQVAKNNSVINCQVANCGVQYNGAVGIWCGLTAGTTLENNQICDLPYTGISVGWMWNPTPTPARANTARGNHIHHIMQTLSDGGGIYMLGLQPGSRLENNLIHDVTLNVGRAESNGMFLDEGITDVIVSDNIIYNIAKSPIRFHKATTNLVTNNLLFCKDGVPAFAYNNTDETLIKKVDNQVYHPSDKNYTTALEEAVRRWKNP